MTSLYFAVMETMLCLATVGQWLAYVGHHGAGLAGATCSEAQKNECRRTVGGGSGDDSGFRPSSSSSSSDLTAAAAAASAASVAGVCSRKQYVHFTHVCTVRNYMPTIDFCCCLAAANWETVNVDDLVSSSSDSRLLCCRYHQGWNVFRCMDDDDAIETAETTSDGSGPSLWLILPPLLLPISAVVVYCGIRCLVPTKRRRKCCFFRSGSSEDRAAATNTNGTNSGRIPPSSESQQRKGGSGDDDMDATNGSGGCCCWGYDSPCGYEMSSEAEECPVIRLQGCRELQELVPHDDYDLKHCFASEHRHPLGHTAVERGYNLQGNCSSRGWCTSSGCTGCTGSYCSDMSSADGALHRHLSAYQREPYMLPSISGENRLSPSAPPSSPPDACPSSDYPLAATYLTGVEDCSCSCNRRLGNSIAPSLVSRSCAGNEPDETTTASCPGCGNRRRRDELLPVAPPSYDDCVPL